MLKLPKHLYTAEQVRAMDRHAIERCGIAGIVLMERAGVAAFQALRRRWPDARFVSVVCGGGNNGGDGYVIARLALEAGLDVRAYAVRSPDSLSGDARLAFQAYRDAGGSWLSYVPAQLEHAEVVVDALFGTGLNRDLANEDAAVVRAINDCEAGVLSVDIPSGLSANTGAALGTVVEADVTVSFIGLKRGLFTGEGPAHRGKLILDELGTPAEVRNAQVASAELICSEDCRMPPRSAIAHKGHFGHVAVIGGDTGYGGAAFLAASAAARVGAGLVSVAAHPAHASAFNAARPELMCRGIEKPEDLKPILKHATVLAVGPGLGQRDWAQQMMECVLAAGLPMVVDADALNFLARNPTRRDDWILTPHPGEAARLLGTSTAEIGRDRFTAITELQARYGGVVVLKGAGSLVLNSEGPIAMCTAGNPGMASGGMGDVLTGVIGGLLAQQLPPLMAARYAVQWHAEAADQAAEEGGQRGLLASDLLAPLRQRSNQ